jgi:hypothetical protein
MRKLSCEGDRLAIMAVILASCSFDASKLRTPDRGDSSTSVDHASSGPDQTIGVEDAAWIPPSTLDAGVPYDGAGDPADTGMDEASTSKDAPVWEALLASDAVGSGGSGGAGGLPDTGGDVGTGGSAGPDGGGSSPADGPAETGGTGTPNTGGSLGSGGSTDGAGNRDSGGADTDAPTSSGCADGTGGACAGLPDAQTESDVPVMGDAVLADTVDLRPDSAGHLLCSTGCAVCTAPLTRNGATSTARQTTSFASALLPSPNLLGATISLRLCVAEGSTTHAQLRAYVQTFSGSYPQYVGNGGTVTNLANLSCAQGMHTISYPIAASGNFLGVVDRWGISVGAPDGSYSYDTVVVKIDSVTFTDVPAKAGSIPVWEFAPIDGAANLQNVAADPLNPPYVDPEGTVTWTATD